MYFLTIDKGTVWASATGKRQRLRRGRDVEAREKSVQPVQPSAKNGRYFMR